MQGIAKPTGDARGWLAPHRAHSPREEMLDRLIHYVGIAAAVVGVIWLVVIASAAGDSRRILSTLAYAAGLMAMLFCSAAYNQAQASPRRELLRRLDHAAIFVMIAGTYTPFTLTRLTGAWSLAMTAAIWGLALAGVAIKLLRPHLFGRLSVALYLALGWIGLIAVRPLLAAVDPTAMILLGIGGALYSIGACFYLWHRLPFQNAVWHGFVLSAAACHYAAIMLGVALVSR